MNIESSIPKYSEIYDMQLEMQQAAKARAIGACATEPILSGSDLATDQPEASADQQ